LIESGARTRERSAQWAVASALAHTALIGLAVAATANAPHIQSVEILPRDPLIFIQPRVPAARESPSRPAGSAVSPPALREMGAIVIPAIPRIDPGVPMTPERSVFSEIISATGLRAGAPTSVPPDGIYTDRAVDRVVTPRGDNPPPDYPAQLRVAGIEGDVVVRFVVDISGRVEPASIAVLQSTHPSFALAVRQWLQRTRYAPAQVGGGAVRQLVEQRVGFTIR
jgi:protein TonB